VRRLMAGSLALLVVSGVVAILLFRPATSGAPADGCVTCHTGVAGLDTAHRPERIGCASCHRGDHTARDAARAHAAMVRVPGNLLDAAQTCGQGGCHESILARVEHSIMTTMTGVIEINRRVLGETVDPSAPPPHASRLGTGVADSHLRELCVSCHLGQVKTEWGPIGQESRGGGCNACHLVYDAAAREALERYRATPTESRTASPHAHPSFTINPGNDHCFGCHSRSGRIATSYEGWHELRGEPTAGADPARVRRLDDGRFFERVVPDVHHERGLDCIDCHTSWEVMGSGAIATRKSDQVRIDCADCHAAKLNGIAASAIDPESRALLALRKWTVDPSQRIGTTGNGDALVNVFVDSDGRGQLRRKRTGESRALKPPLAVCTEGKGHARLACASCHSAWAPRCTTCHTQFDPQDVGFDHLDQQWVRGTWNETAGPFEAVLPTLGVRRYKEADGREHSIIETFVPGMIMTFDRNRDAGKAADVIFRRLYSRIFAHTVRREARSCESCHRDPVALGYGSGALRFEKAGANGRWRFVPRQKPSPHDGLPADAWIGYLQTRDGMVSTRDDVRPFSVAEQKRVLRVGACLTCHAGDSTVMKQAIADFDGVLERRSRRCALPVWP